MNFFWIMERSDDFLKHEGSFHTLLTDLDGFFIHLFIHCLSDGVVITLYHGRTVMNKK